MTKKPAIGGTDLPSRFHVSGFRGGFAFTRALFIVLLVIISRSIIIIIIIIIIITTMSCCFLIAEHSRTIFGINTSSSILHNDINVIVRLLAVHDCHAAMPSFCSVILAEEDRHGRHGGMFLFEEEVARRNLMIYRCL